jgi:hypothetical protein
VLSAASETPGRNPKAEGLEFTNLTAMQGKRSWRLDAGILIWPQTANWTVHLLHGYTWLAAIAHHMQEDLLFPAVSFVYSLFSRIAIGSFNADNELLQV